MPSPFPPAPALLLGVDFSSRPTRRKPVVVAHGERRGDVLRLDGLAACESLADFEAWLRAKPAWLGAFDFPFGLPRELVEQLGWPLQWRALVGHYAALERDAIRDTFAAFCDARPAGSKFAHRACDIPAGASPSMKWVNPPVAYMLHAGVPVLLAVGACLPQVGWDGEGAGRIALEGYPGLLAREIVARRSYKSDDAAKRTPERLIARKDIVEALEQGRTRLGLRLKLSHAQREALVDDASGDRLDAVLCLVQAGWSAVQPRLGVPEGHDLLEGWIAAAGMTASGRVA